MIEQLCEPSPHILYQAKGLRYKSMEKGCSEDEFRMVLRRIKHLLIDVQNVNDKKDEN